MDLIEALTLTICHKTGKSFAGVNGWLQQKDDYDLLLLMFQFQLMDPSKTLH